jgi:hypothetical protein
VPSYTKKLRAVLSPEVESVLKKLSTPEKIQDYLDTLKINFDTSGDLLSTQRILHEARAQCIEAAMLAAASLSYHGEVPLLMDFQTVSYDEDHVVALFKRGGYFGAISKTNHGVLRWRDPIYKSMRELAMSYFHEYFAYDGRKTMRAFSKPFDLRRYDPVFWVMGGKSLEQIAGDLDESPHFFVIPKNMRMRRVSQVELKQLDIVEWERPK